MRKLGRFIVPGDAIYWVRDFPWLVISVIVDHEHGYVSVLILGTGTHPLDTWSFGFDEGVNVL